MKTSDKLLIGLLTLTLLVLVGSDMALKAEYNKIDFKNPFYDYVPTALARFKVIKLNGSTQGLIQFQPGNTYTLRVRKESVSEISYHQNGDTLEVSYHPEADGPQPKPGEAFRGIPLATLTAPTLQALLVQGTNCVLTQVTGANLTVSADGAGVLMTDSHIQNLVMTARRGSVFQTTPTPQRIQAATVTARDSSRLTVERDVFGTLNLQADSLSTINLPGSLLRKL